MSPEVPRPSRRLAPLFLAAAPLALSATLLLSGCAGGPSLTAQAVALDAHPDQATAEEYILAMPEAYEKEASPEAFRSRVLAARTLPQNAGRDADSLYLPATGSAPAKSFRVNRKRHSVRMQIIDRQSDKPQKSVERLRYKGQWWNLNSPDNPW